MAPLQKYSRPQPSKTPSPSQQEPVKTQKSFWPMNKWQTTVWFFNIILATFVTYVVLGLICTGKWTNFFISSKVAFEQTLIYFGVFVAGYILFHTILGQIVDVLFNKSNTNVYRAITNVIWNTIMWGGIFVIFFIIGKNDQKLSTLRNYFVDMFIAGRIIFSIGYILGSAINHQAFRSTGFGLTIGSIFLIMAQALGYSASSYFST